MPRLLVVLLCCSLLLTAGGSPTSAVASTRSASAAPAKGTAAKRTAAKRTAAKRTAAKRTAAKRLAAKRAAARRRACTPTRRTSVTRSRTRARIASPRRSTRVSVRRTRVRAGVVRRCTTRRQVVRRPISAPRAPQDGQPADPVPVTQTTTTTTTCVCVPASSAAPASGSSTAAPSAAGPSAEPAAAPAQAAPAPAGGLRFGLVANVHYEARYVTPNATLDGLRAAGVTSLREQMQWAAVEKTRGQFDWTRYDRLYTAASKRGIAIVPLIFSPPAWASPTWNTLPDPALYADFAAAVARRYGPEGSFWRAHPELPASGASTWFELWNEPYEAAFSAGGVDPARYARLVAAAGRAIHDVHPQAKVLMAMTHKSYGGKAWVDAVHDAVPDLGAHYDGVAQHPYLYAQSHDDPENWFKRDLDRVRSRMLARGADKPVQITEIGWATCPGTDERCLTEAEQATALRRAVSELRTKYGWVESVHFYQEKDNTAPASQDPDQSEHWYGLKRHDGTPKPAWRALVELATAAG